MVRQHAPGALEAEVLRRVRASRTPCSGRQVWQSFADDPAPPARTTVLTVLARLEAKGAIRREVTGDVVTFVPDAPESEVVAGQMEQLLAAAGDRRAVLSQFAGLLDEGDLRDLRDLIDSTEPDRTDRR